jgi:hypothetical protein
MHFYLFEVAHTSEVWKFELLSFIWMFKVGPRRRLRSGAIGEQGVGAGGELQSVRSN